jgi:hypothetical protein
MKSKGSASNASRSPLTRNMAAPPSSTPIEGKTLSIGVYNLSSPTFRQFSKMRRCYLYILSGAAAVITIGAVFHRTVFGAWNICAFAVGIALSPIFSALQDFGLDPSSPLVQRGIELRHTARKLAEHNSASWDVDPIISAYIPPGTSFQDAFRTLRAAHASIEGPKLFVGTRPDGKTPEWFGVRAIIFFGGIAGGPQAWFLLETDQPPTIIQRASGFTMSVYL